jgi:hypothetical protein
MATKWVALPVAALTLRQDWRETYDQLLRGKLVGRQVNGRWHVTRESLEAAVEAQQEPENVP